MAIERFPDVSLADESGLLAIGGDLEVESLLLAYRSGIFPWPLGDEDELLWFAPAQRAVLFLNEARIPRRLGRKMRSRRLEFKIDSSFARVIRACAEAKNRPKQKGTWITSQMIAAYIALHRAGYCHSIECYEAGKSLGGLYGVAIGNMFAGESMFHEETDGSKFCLCFLINYLADRAVEWIDCQQMTPLLGSFGAKEIAREEFMVLLGAAVNQDAKLF